MATVRDSTLYTKAHVSKQIVEPYELDGRAVPIPFQHTVVAGETGGASAGAQDQVRLCVVKAHQTVVGIDFAAEALEDSAGVNSTLEIGTSDDTDRFMKAKEFDVENAVAAPMPYAGMFYRPTADTVVLGTWKAGNPKVGATFKGVLWVIPAR